MDGKVSLCVVYLFFDVFVVNVGFKGVVFLFKDLFFKSILGY